MSSRTSRMLELCDLYAAAAGAPRSSSSPPELCWDCTMESSFCLSALGKAAASTTEPSDLRSLSTLEMSICANEAGFLAISRSIATMARPMVSTTSASSASLAPKFADSFSRTCVALLRSASSVEMLPASSSILASAASSSLVDLVMAASSFSFLAVAVLISKPLLADASSHHSMKALYVFSSCSPSFVTFAASPSKSFRT
mmetsp:Transcript_3942/g.11517  ORF Transcript_3942/g.11517 Transcript_3942/m.11517 type:complete len:201 (+) Transcript_3942:1522-2124(+)